jgi:hypothetical protein
MNHGLFRSWEDVAVVLNDEPQGSLLRIPKGQLPHPSEVGAKPSMGLPVGQQADFRFTMNDCRCLHVRIFQDRYEAHIDSVDPACSIVEHLRKDAPGTYTTAAAGLGALAGLILGGGKKEGMLAGALIGLAVGAATIPEQKKPGPERA